MQATDTGPNVLLVRAIRHVPKYGLALDLGSGKCRDSRFLLNLGFETVIAIDRTQPEFIPSRDGFKFIKATLETAALPMHADLVNAQFVLSFIKNVSDLINKIHETLVQGGVFVGQFFSPEDAFCKNPNISCYNIEQAKELLKEFIPVSITEESRFSSDNGMHYKTWNTVDFIVRKQ